MRAYNLPDHFMLGVFLHLPSADVLSLLLTCRGFNAAFQRVDRSLDTIRVSYLNNQGGDANRFGRLIDVFGTEELEGQWAVPSADAFEQELVRRAQRTIGTILTALFDFNRRTDSRMRFVVAGGAAVGVLDVRFAGFGDIDVFVAHNGAPPEECHAALRGLLVGVGTKLVETFAEEWTEDAPTMGGYAIVKNASTMSVMAEANDASRTVPPLQFIFRRVTCMEELLCFFDLDCCRFGYDGRTVMTTSEGLRSLELRTNYCGLEHENKELYAKRTLKYFKRALQQTLYRFVHPLGYLFPPKRFLAEARVKRVWPFKCNDDTLVTWVDRNGVSRTNRFSDEAFEGGAEPAFYHALASLPFEAVATIAQVGIETYCHKEVFNVHEAKEAAEGHVFALSFAWLYTLDRSCFYSGGYDKIHLSAKYNIVKCDVTGVYSKVL